MANFINYFSDDEIQSEIKPDTFFEGYQLQIFESNRRAKSLAYITLWTHISNSANVSDYVMSIYYGDGDLYNRYFIPDYTEARNRFISLRDAIIHALHNEYLILTNAKVTNVL